MKRVSIRIKLALPAVILSFMLCGVLFFTTNHGLTLFHRYILTLSQDLAMEGFKKEMRSATEIAASAIQEIYNTSTIPAEQKLQEAAALVRKLRFGKDGYFYAYRKGTGINLIHGTNAKLEGTSLWDLQSPDKKQFIIRDLDKAAEEESMFVKFYWGKPGGEPDTVYPKLGTAMMVPGTDIWVGTGTYIDDIDATLDQINTSLSGYSRQTRTLFLAISVLAPFIFMFILMLGINSITRPIRSLSNFVQQSRGTDLRNPPPRSARRFQDEISDLEITISSLFTQFRDILTEVKASVSQSGQLSSKLHEGSMKIARSANITENTVESIAAAAGQLASEARTNLKFCAELEQFIAENSNLANKQKEYAEKTSQEIIEINRDQSKIFDLTENLYTAASDFRDAARNGADQVSKAVTNLESAEKSAAAISEVIELINNIADQTHILSMNAAIQAAHAGDSGKGFAVVANEIRTLAASSRTNAQKITQSLNEIATSVQTSKESTQDVQKTFHVINIGSETVKQSTETIFQSSSTLTQSGSRIVQSLQELTDSAKIVNSSSRDALLKVSTLAQSSDELSSLSENLDTASGTLKENMTTITEETKAITSLTDSNEKNTETLSGSIGRFQT